MAAVVEQQAEPYTSWTDEGRYAAVRATGATAALTVLPLVHDKHVRMLLGEHLPIIPHEATLQVLFREWWGLGHRDIAMLMVYLECENLRIMEQHRIAYEAMVAAEKRKPPVQDGGSQATRKARAKRKGNRGRR